MPPRAATAVLARRLGARIRVLREEAGLTQERLAWASDLSKPYLSQIEAGKRIPAVAVLDRLAGRLGTEVADFFIHRPADARGQLFEALRHRPAAEAEALLKRLS